MNIVFLNHMFIIHFKHIYQKLKVGRRETVGPRYRKNCQIRDLKELDLTHRYSSINGIISLD